MRVINLDASHWTSVEAFYEALLVALGAPHWHGLSVDAVIDSVIFGGINEVEPPYTIKLTGVRRTAERVRSEIEVMRDALRHARQEYKALKGRDVEVGLEVDS